MQEGARMSRCEKKTEAQWSVKAIMQPITVEVRTHDREAISSASSPGVFNEVHSYTVTKSDISETSTSGSARPSKVGI